MSGVVHDQCSLLHLLFDKARNIRIAVACRRTDAVVGIPHDTLYGKVRIAVFYQSRYGVGIGHVSIVVAVIAHDAEHVLP